MTSHHCTYKNNSFSDPLILHPISSWRTTITHREYNKSSFDICRTKIQKLLRYHSDDDVTKYSYLIERICFWTIHYFSRVYDTSYLARKLCPHLYHPTHQNTTTIDSCRWIFENNMSFCCSIYISYIMNFTNYISQDYGNVSVDNRHDSRCIVCRLE